MRSSVAAALETATTVIAAARILSRRFNTHTDHESLASRRRFSDRTIVSVTSGNLVKSSGLLRKNWQQQGMKFTIRVMKTHPSAQPLGFFDVELRVPSLEAKGNPLSRLAEWVETTDGEVHADSAYRSAARAMLAQKHVTSRIHEHALRAGGLPQPSFERRAESLRIGEKAIARSPGFALASNTSLAT